MGTERRPEIIGLGKARGSRTITRAEAAQMLVDARDPSERPLSPQVAERLMRRVGVDERGWCTDEEAASDLAVKSIPGALAMAGKDIAEIKSIVFATGLPDHLGVPTGTIVIKKLGGSYEVATADISGACPGFIHALRTVYTDLTSPYGVGGPQIVVASEPASKGINPKYPETFVLFGDASGAVVIDLTEVDSPSTLAKFHYEIDPDLEILTVPAGGSRITVDEEALRQGLTYIKMDGEKVKNKAIEMMYMAAKKVLEKAKVTFNQINLVISHQANLEIIKALQKKLGLPDEKMFVNIDRYGNTSAASIPVALTEAFEQGRLNRGDIVLAVTFGAGLNAAAAVLPMYGLPERKSA